MHLKPIKNAFKRVYKLRLKRVLNAMFKTSFKRRLNEIKNAVYTLIFFNL